MNPLDILFCRNNSLFQEAIKSPERYSLNRMRSILSRNSETEYGRKFGFKYIRTFTEFKRNIPIVRYRDIKKWIERAYNGERGALSQEDILSFYKTSATEGGCKYIPFTPSLRGQVNSGRRFWLYNLLKNHPRLLGGKFLPIVSPAIDSFSPSGIPCGSNTGRILQDMPPIIRRACPIPFSVFSIDEYETRCFMLLLYALMEDIRFIITSNPLTLINLALKLEEWKDRFLEFLERGWTNWTESGDMKMSILPPLKRVERFSSELKRLKGVMKREKLRPFHIWKNLTLLSTWKGGDAELYIPFLKEYFGDIAVIDPGYSATEGFFAIPLRFDMDGGLLNLPNHFFEFLPLNEGQTDTLAFSDLEEGMEYSLVVTTGGGLYRYRVEDIVRVMGFINRVPVIKFIRKEGGIISMTGEKLSSEQVKEGMKVFLRDIGIRVRFSTLIAIKGDPSKKEIPYYLIAFEPEGGTFPPSYQVERATNSLDEEISSINPEYKEKRASHRIAPMKATILWKGAYERFVAKKREKGAPDAQVKIPLLMKEELFKEMWMTK